MGLDYQSSLAERIFADANVVKALLVSAETLTEEQSGINGLILATSIWLEDGDILFEDYKYEEKWNELIFRYLAKLYDAIDENKSTKDLHKNMSIHTKALKKASLSRWIGVLDNYKLKTALSPQNQKPLYLPRQTRTVLSSFGPFSDMMPLTELLANIEDEIDSYRVNQSKPVNVAPKATSTPVNKAINIVD